MTHEELLQWRNQMGFTQRQAAEALGMTQPNYCDLEHGKNPRTGNARPINRRTELACAALAAGIKKLELYR